MADSELRQYPRGQIAFGGGNLQQSINAKFTATNNAKVKATLARNPSGVVLGDKTVEVTWETLVDEDGPERDYLAKVDSGAVGNLRFKFPGGITIALIVAVAEVTGEVTLDDGVKLSLKAVGMRVKS